MVGTAPTKQLQRQQMRGESGVASVRVPPEQNATGDDDAAKKQLPRPEKITTNI